MKSFGLFSSNNYVYWWLLILSSVTFAPYCHVATALSNNKYNNDESIHPKNKYYSYKTFKRLSLPSVAYYMASNFATRLLKLQPDEIPPSSTTTSPNIIGQQQQQQRQRRRVALITGSNTGVGYQTAKTLVWSHGFEVIIACRSQEKAVQACQTINNDNANANANAKMNAQTTSTSGKAVFVEQPLDLADFESVRAFATLIHERYDKIDVLINNAGRNSASPPSYTDVVDEMSTNTSFSSKSTNPTINSNRNYFLDLLFQTNFLGHFLLTNLLLDKCERIVNLGSVMHHFPKYSKHDNDNVSSMEFWKRVAIVSDDNDPPAAATIDMSSSNNNASNKSVDRKTYAPSKLAAILFSAELNRRYRKNKEIQAISVNPGSVNSDIWRNYPSFIRTLYGIFFLTPEQGCSTSVAASVLDFDDETIKDNDDVLYLQPYRLPFQKSGQPPFPLFEMLGPYQGYVITQPRLPDDGGIQAGKSLFAVCEELTDCKYP